MNRGNLQSAYSLLLTFKDLSNSDFK